MNLCQHSHEDLSFSTFQSLNYACPTSCLFFVKGLFMLPEFCSARLLLDKIEIDSTCHVYLNSI